MNQFLDLLPTDPVNYKLETIGLESEYFVNNLGTFFFILLIYLLLALIWLIICIFALICPAKLLRELRAKIGKKLFWNGLVEVTFESYLMVCLCGFITLENRMSFSGFGESFQTYSALVTIAIYMLIPMIAFIGVLANFS